MWLRSTCQNSGPLECPTPRENLSNSLFCLFHQEQPSRARSGLYPTFQSVTNLRSACRGMFFPILRLGTSFINTVPSWSVCLFDSIIIVHCSASVPAFWVRSSARHIPFRILAPDRTAVPKRQIFTGFSTHTAVNSRAYDKRIRTRRMQRSAMSSFVRPDFQIRPEDKGCNIFTQTLDDPFNDIFDQYVNLDSSDSSDFLNDSTRSNLCGEVDIAFDTGTASNGSYTVGPPPTSIRSPTSDQPHEVGQALTLWPAQERVASPCQRRKFRVDQARSIRATIPGPELLNIKGKSIIQARAFINPTSPPSTPPSTPSQKIAHSATATSKTTVRHRDRISKTPNRINNASSKMMSPSYYHRQETPSFQEWTQRFEQFNLQGMASNSMLSPPPSSRVSQQENPAGLWESQRNSSFEFSDPPELNDEGMVAMYKYRTTNMGPGFGSSSPTLVNRDKRTRQHARMSSSKDTYSSPVVAPQPQRSLSWMQSTPTPSENEHTPPLDSQQSWTGAIQVQQQTTSQQQIQQQPWYDTAQLPERYTPQAFQNMDFATQGLMIQCDDSYSPYVGEDSSDDYLTSTTSNPYQSTIAAEVFPTDLYPTTNPPPHQRTPSLSSSPSPPTSKSRRSSKSANHRRRKSSTSPSTPKTPTSAIGFVNFTPNDSKRILTGVAPSGSSKTKARREKEAIERSRRLSQAALRAVQKAGGDLEMLKVEGAWDL